MEKTLTVQNDEGLHARPAAMLVKNASGFQSDIVLKTADKEANAKSLMSVMALGLKKDAQVTVVADGADAEEALTKLSTLFENKFDIH